MNSRALILGVRLLLAVAVLVDLAAAVSTFRLLRLVDEAQQLGQATLNYDAEPLEQTHALVRTLQLGVYAVGVLVFVLWVGGRGRPTGRLPGAAVRMFAFGALLVVGGSLFWPSWVDGEPLVQLEAAAIAQLVGNLLGIAAAVVGFLVVGRTHIPAPE